MQLFEDHACLGRAVWVVGWWVLGGSGSLVVVGFGLFGTMEKTGVWDHGPRPLFDPAFGTSCVGPFGTTVWDHSVWDLGPGVGEQLAGTTIWDYGCGVFGTSCLGPWEFWTGCLGLCLGPPFRATGVLDHGCLGCLGPTWTIVLGLWVFGTSRLGPPFGTMLGTTDHGCLGPLFGHVGSSVSQTSPLGAEKMRTNFPTEEKRL